MTKFDEAAVADAVGAPLEQGVMAPRPKRADGRRAALAGRRLLQSAALVARTIRTCVQPQRVCRGLRPATWRPSRPLLMGGLPLLRVLEVTLDDRAAIDPEAVQATRFDGRLLALFAVTSLDELPGLRESGGVKLFGAFGKLEVDHLCSPVVGCTAHPMTEEYVMMTQYARGWNVKMAAHWKRHNG